MAGKDSKMPKIRKALVSAEERKVIGKILKGKGFNVGNFIGY